MSHVPAIGAALDNGKSGEPYWKKVFDGFRALQKSGSQDQARRHPAGLQRSCRRISLDIIPTFALGCAAEFPVADEGWGPRRWPKVIGHPELAAHHRAVGDPRRVRPHGRPTRWRSTNGLTVRCR